MGAYSGEALIGIITVSRSVRTVMVPAVVPAALPGICPRQILFLMGTLVPGTADSLPATPGELN